MQEIQNENNSKRIINGKEFGTQQGIVAAMFHGTGLFLYKLVSGRGRAKEEVIVKYDSSYPAHRIAKDLQSLRLCFETVEDYDDYLKESLGHLLPNSYDAVAKLEGVEYIVDKFKLLSTKSRDWTKANSLIIELDNVLNAGLTNE